MMSLSLMRGLDPRIQSQTPKLQSFALDCRVEPGNEEIWLNQIARLLNRNLSFREALQAAEKSSIFRFRAVMNPCAKPFYLNQKVKP